MNDLHLSVADAPTVPGALRGPIGWSLFVLAARATAPFSFGLVEHTVRLAQLVLDVHLLG